ncbi:hypothetical protein [Blastopirellula retiformator]|uniref:Uncharacterized protein n=1 Tax=Blastopirellula retiformator TaxID=2527970 RepID=A0A5C5V1P9_9BACT|nr:hypothetical protein [Blastopirellula retiformator]TWT31662.1 hypothetical protein Enr8_35860 [Blastopirellula retiformator]
MTLDIPSQYEAILQDAVSSGAFADKKAALVHALMLLKAEQQSAPSKRSEDLAAKFRDWAVGHSAVNHHVDDSRESIY